MHFFIMKIPDKREPQQFFLVIGTTLASDNPLCSRCNLLERI